MCVSAPKVPKYDPPVTLEAPEPEKAPDPLKDEETMDGEKSRRRVNRKGLSELRTDLKIPSAPKASGDLTIPRG